jgi:hypothetical protein
MVVSAEGWQGLYTAVLDGQEIANPADRLVVVTRRRAIDERRSRLVADRGRGLGAREVRAASRTSPGASTTCGVCESSSKVLRERLSARECEAATLCYVQGLSRPEAKSTRACGCVNSVGSRRLASGRPGRRSALSLAEPAISGVQPKPDA